MNNNQGIIIDPTKSSKMIGSPQVSAPSVSDSGMSLGITKAVSNGIMDLGTAFQKLKDFQSKSYGLTTEASVDDDISNTMLEAQTNKDFYKTNDGINALESKVNEKLATYRKTSLEQGYDTEYVDAFEARIRHKLQMAKNNFLVKNYEYQEKVTLDNYIHSQEMAQQNNERYMALGDYSSALAGTQQVINNMISAGNAGIIDMAKVATGIKGVWKGNFNAFGLSLINKPNAQAELERYSKMTAGEFFEQFKNFNTKINGEDFMIGADEYEEFKSGINQAQAELNRRNKGVKEMTLMQEMNLREKWANKPYEAYAETNNLMAGYIFKDQDVINVNNGHYGTNFESYQDFKDAGLPIIYPPESFTGMKDFYNDTNNSQEAVMVKSIQDKNRFVGGFSKEIQDDYLDSTNKGMTLGSLGTKAYFEDPTTYSLINSVNTSNNRQKIATFSDKLTDTSIDTMKMFDSLPARVTDTKGLGRGGIAFYANDVFSPKSEKDNRAEIAVGGMWNALNYLAKKGDKKAQRAYDDISNQRLNKFKVALYDQTLGVLTKDLADDADIDKENVGVPISSLQPKFQQQVLNAFIENNDDLVKEANNETAYLLKKFTEDYKPIDLGKKGIFYVGKDIDTGKASDTVAEYLQNNSFYTYATNEKGEVAQLEVPKSSISISNELGDNRLVLEYGGRNLTDKEGKPHILNLDITIKPKVAKIETISSQTQNEKFEKEVVKVIAPQKIDDVAVPQKTYENVIKNTMNEIMEKDNGVVKHDTLLKLVGRKEIPDLMKRDLVEKTELLLESPFLNEEPVYLNIEPLEIEIEPILNENETPKIKRLNVTGGNLNFVEEFITEDIQSPLEIRESNINVSNGAFLDDKIEIKNSTDNVLENIEFKEISKPKEVSIEDSLIKIANARYSGKGQGVVPSYIMDKLIDKENLPKQVKWFIDEMENNPKTGDKRIKEYHDLVVPKAGLNANANWCATSLLASFIETGTEIKHRTASAQQVYKNKKRDISIDKASAGNVMVFRNRDKNGKRTWTGHVNMVVYKNDDYIVAIGGNQSTENSNERDGLNYINYKVYSIKKLKEDISKKDLSIIEI